MKRIVGIALALTLVLPVLALAASALPDYDKEVVRVTWKCDGGTTSIVLYRTETYKLDVTTTKPGHTFYDLADSTGEQFLYKTAGSTEVTSLSHEEWDAKLEEQAPNLYRAIHGGGRGDCGEVK